jgi:hypothetical protein
MYPFMYLGMYPFMYLGMYRLMYFFSSFAMGILKVPISGRQSGFQFHCTLNPYVAIGRGSGTDLRSDFEQKAEGVFS